jgi:uncharacterized Zn finger protein (UPF0148 family)
MPGEKPATRICSQCGATILPEEFREQKAVRYKGSLLCPSCAAEVKAKIIAAKKEEEAANNEQDPEEVPIALVDEEDKPRVAAGPSEQIHGFSGAEMTAQRAEHRYHRELLHDTRSATRCRTFHCKMTDASFQNINEQINEWVDEHEDIEIKFALSNVGVVEGKHADPHLIITVFY